MKILRALTAGLVIWCLIFVVWSIMIFAPWFKDLGNWQWAFHYILLIPIVVFGLFYYYKAKVKTNGITVGIIILITGIILDLIITMPFFVAPQGITKSGFFLNPFMVVGYIELLVISYLYWKKKIA